MTGQRARELRNFFERAVVLGKPPTIGMHDLSPDMTKPARGVPASRLLADVERAHIESVLEDQDWNI